jgi:hypothetical protein
MIKSGEMSRILEIFEAGIDDLDDLLLQGRLDRVSEIYARAKHAYLRADLESLRVCFDTLPGLLKKVPASAQETLPCLIGLRLRIREGEVFEEKTLESLRRKVARYPAPWPAEGLMLLGLIAMNQGLSALSDRWFHQASLEMQKLGLHKNALRAELNSLSSRSHIEPDKKRLIRASFRLLERARAADEPGVQGVVLLNLSWEFFRARALQIALLYANQSVSALEPLNGKIDYYRARIQRALVLRAMERNAEAEEDLEACAICSFPEIHAARRVVEREDLGDLEKHLSPAWRIRRDHLAGKKQKGAWLTPLTPTQNKLLELLAEKPRSRTELVEAFYGKVRDMESAYNRLNVTLIRLQKVIPELIVKDGARFTLSEEG